MPLKVIDNNKSSSKQFPKLMRNINTNAIGFFSNEYSGIMLVTTPASTVTSGKIFTNVIPNHWADYNEPLTIQNV